MQSCSWSRTSRCSPYPGPEHPDATERQSPSMTAVQHSKRHCMIVHAHYPIGEVRVEREALALLANGYEVDVICLRTNGEPATSVEDGVHVYRLPVTRHKGKGVFVQFLEYLAFFFLAFVQ